LISGGDNMGKFISGSINCKIIFNDLYVDEGDDHLDAIFPDGWEGEMTDYNLSISSEEYEE
jgi:hypothetical protein